MPGNSGATGEDIQLAIANGDLSWYELHCYSDDECHKGTVRTDDTGMCQCPEGKEFFQDKDRCESSLEQECPGAWREWNNECEMFSHEC